MQTTIGTVIAFGRDGNAAEFQVSGWYGPEDERTWTAGGESRLSVKAPVAPFGYFIEIDWSPILDPPYLSGQTILIKINGRVIKGLQVSRPGLIAFLCPPPEPGETKIEITFQHPDFIRPSDFQKSDDTRELSLSFHRVRFLILQEPWGKTERACSSEVINPSDEASMISQAESISGMKLNGLLHHFEMLSGNCDMGLALRALGYESLSLLRFAGAAPSVAERGLQTNFAGLGVRTDARIVNNPIKEWMINDEFGLSFHSGQSSKLISKENVLKRFQSYEKILLRKFLEDLDLGEKIFVYSDHKNYLPSAVENVLPLFLALRRRSKAKMLWVCPAGDNVQEKGSVKEIVPGLAQAFLDIIAPPMLAGGGVTVSGWLTVLCNAARVFNLQTA